MKKLIISIFTAALLSLGVNASAEEDITTIASKEWRAYVEPLAPMGERLITELTDPQNPLLRQELYRAVISQVATGYLALLHADAEHPDFWPYLTGAFGYLGPNPDNDYYATPVDDNGIYKITGYRGTVKRVDFQLGTGAFVPRGVVDDQKLGVTLANYDLDSLPLNDDGYFEVILSPERPKGYEGSWWQLHPKSSYLLLRQISYDWLNEVDGRFAIERLDQPAVKPRASVEDIKTGLNHIKVWAESQVKVSSDFAKSIRKRGWVNTVGYLDLTEYGGIVTQKYLYGIFDLQPDEALIIESEMPEHCRYISIHLTDDLFFTLDYMHRQTSLNGFTAKIDSDKKFRVVISAQDPGISNWLDTAGYKTGAIQSRWEECTSWPTHTTIKVKITDVHKFLPKDILKVSAKERDTAIRLRRRGAQMRKRW